MDALFIGILIELYKCLVCDTKCGQHFSEDLCLRTKIDKTNIDFPILITVFVFDLWCYKLVEF